MLESRSRPGYQEMVDVFEDLRRAVMEAGECPRPEKFVSAIFQYVNGFSKENAELTPVWSYAIIDSGREASGDSFVAQDAGKWVEKVLLRKFGENPIGQGAVIRLAMTVE